MKTTALDNILEAFDKMDLFSFKKYVDENRGILIHKNKQHIIDAHNYSQRGVHGEIYYNMVYGDTTNKETLK